MSSTKTAKIEQFIHLGLHLSIICSSRRFISFRTIKKLSLANLSFPNHKLYRMEYIKSHQKVFIFHELVNTLFEIIATIQSKNQFYPYKNCIKLYQMINCNVI